VKGLKLEILILRIPSFRKHLDSPEVLVECAQLTIVLDVREVFACFEFLQNHLCPNLEPSTSPHEKYRRFVWPVFLC
jgi:hypothetical protein